MFFIALILIIITVFSIVGIIGNAHKIEFRKDFSRTLFYGVLLILISIAGNGLVEGRWSNDDIINFLRLKNFGESGFFKTFYLFGCTFFICSFTAFLVSRPFIKKFLPNNYSFITEAFVHRKIKDFFLKKIEIVETENMKGFEKMKKTYVDAMGMGLVSIYLLAILFHLIIPVFCLFLLYISIKTIIMEKSGLAFLGLMSAVIGLLISGLFFPFWRKYAFPQIVLDENGISAYSLLKVINVRWDEVEQIKPIEKHIEVKTKKGNFFFRATMKEKDTDYPGLKSNFMNPFKYAWIYENGIETPGTPENCPLYIEIQKHLADKLK